MKVTVRDLFGKVATFDVEEDELVENVKALVEVHLGIPLANQLLSLNGRNLSNETTLRQCGVKEADVLQAQQPLFNFTLPNPSQAGGSNLAPPARQPGPAPPRIDPSMEIARIQSNPHMLAQLKSSNPELGAAVERGDVETVRRAMEAQAKEKMEAEAAKQRAIARLNANPFDAEAQKEIEEHIRMENVRENIEAAIEYNPESFGRVVMLYVDCKIDGTPVKAFVDSGAQSTILSIQCAERCGIMRLVDKRFAGVAKGVGTAKIIGRVHLAPLQIGNSFYNCSFTIMDNPDMDFLLGLDNLRRHQACIDLRENVLKIGPESVPFLGEGDLPHEYRDGVPLNDEELKQAGIDPSQAVSGSSSAPQPQTTQSTGANQTQPPPAGAAGGGGGVDEDKIQRLIALGFPREAVVKFLEIAGGNEEQAASLLLGE